jgi:signal transduction histidine kinase
MSVPNLPVEPNARRLSRAVGPVFLYGTLSVIALVLVLAGALAYLLRQDAEIEGLRKIEVGGVALVEQAQAALASPSAAARQGLKDELAAWSAIATQKSAALLEGMDRKTAAGQKRSRFAQAHLQLKSDVNAVANNKVRSGLSKQMSADLATFRSSVDDLAGAQKPGPARDLLAIAAGGLTIFAVLVSTLLTLRGIRWRLALVIRSVMREVLEETKQNHEKDRVIVEEKATQALRAKQADLEAQAEALRIALANAEESNLVKTAFLGNVSHEIRTPLNGVLATSEVLAQTDLDEEQKDLVSTIVSSGDQLTRIIGDILDLAQMEAGRFQLEIQPFDVADLAREIVYPYQALAMAKGVQFNLTVPDSDVSTVASDPTRIKQILANIVSNASKFTHKGTIDVTIETVEAGTSMVELRISVSDTGVGIDPVRLPTIFEHFNQADNSSKRTYGGTGLGLTIAKQLVEVLGGQIGVNSERGVGSHFWVAIPVQASTREAIPSDVAPIVTEIPHLGLRVLVAEDNLVNQKMMQKLLQRCACSVDVAENGADAVERALFGNYDVILMDIHMPVMDGVEATVEIRRKEKEWNRKRTPIVAVTADVMEERRRKFMDAGMEDFVPKPVRLATLLPVLQRRADALGTTGKKAEPVTAQ